MFADILTFIAVIGLALGGGITIAAKGAPASRPMSLAWMLLAAAQLLAGLVLLKPLIHGWETARFF